LTTVVGSSSSQKNALPPQIARNGSSGLGANPCQSTDLRESAPAVQLQLSGQGKQGSL